MTSTNQPGIPTFHHLNDSQSQRILWFLEELGIEYTLVCHTRVEGRAPPELKNVHFMGKAPVLVTSENLPIAESSAILGYLIDTYDKEGRFAAQDKIRDESLTSFAGPEYATQFEYLEKQLTDGWFNGKNLGRSDVMLSWPMDFLAAKEYVDFKKYPKILQWRKKVEERDAWKRAIEKGNGYELANI
ncbi:hypothetical protein DID88_004741 [Monilinia fructigena]|uniref:GST N-terminal domain-containing protein n=1 Tax=Monilinia fructigena TaxID=38457 RepID=A0A395IRH5_9HELO|nr:hypothetical protein DID88_004741 [Monilinia fructigena]